MRSALFILVVGVALSACRSSSTLVPNATARTSEAAEVMDRLLAAPIDPATVPGRYYTVDYSSPQTSSLKVWINDVPIVDAPAGEYIGSNILVNGWVESRNTIRIEVNAADESELEASVSVHSVEERERSTDENRITYLKIERDFFAKPTGKPGHEVHTATFEVTDPPPTRLWSALQPVELTSTDREALSELMMTLHSAFKRHDPATIWSLLRFRTLDSSLVGRRDMPDAEMESLLKESMTKKRAKPVPIDSSTLVFEPVANGRLVWIRRADSRYAIEGREGGSSWWMDTYAAKIDGVWMFVR